MPRKLEPKKQLWAVVWANEPTKIVEEVGAPFDDILEPLKTYGAISLRGWCVMPCTPELEEQYRKLKPTA